jgi:DNA-binding winged helix-turn-helix (wHTH) protein/tetratricopeptide (TPR) repeat protein
LESIVQTLPGNLYRFGPFQVNVAAGELLQNGSPVKLQEQPFRLLVVLLEHAGEMVSRAELRNRIWQQDTFVNFDSSLRVAVRKLREALGDDAEHPQYVATIPKQGYRFLIADVQSDATPAPVPMVLSTAPATAMDCLSIPPIQRAGTPRRPSGNWIVASAVLGAIAVAAAVLLFFRHGPRPPGHDTVLLAEFVNSTGDPVFDGTLREGFAIQLEQSPLLSFVSEQRVQQTLGMMGQNADAPLTLALARQVCERIASAAVLGGSIVRLGDRYVLGLRAEECRTGRILAEEQAQASSKEDVLNTLGQMATRFRVRLGESLSTVEKHNVLLVEATTPSLDALKAYSSGWGVLSSSGESAALPFFRHAVEIDSHFAMAYGALGLMYGSIGESALAAENTSEAYAMRNRLSDKEKFFISAYYDGRVTGNQERALQTCEEWSQAYPREFGPHSFLAGFIYPVSGKYEKAVDEGKKMLQLDPDMPIGYVELGYIFAALGRYRDAEDVLRLASRRNLQVPVLLVLQYDVAFLQKNRPDMASAVTMAQGRSGAEDWIADHQAFVLAYSGHLQEARRMSRHAADLAQQGAHTERAAMFETGAALWEAMFGNAQAAQRGATAALALAKNREIEYGTAFALALAGDSAKAKILADDLEQHFPEDTSVRFSYLPVLRAQLALNRGQTAGAIEMLQTATANELGQPRSTLQGFYGALYPIYVRGEAYLAGRRGAEAVAEFQKIINHQGIIISDPIGALAHLELGRSYILLRDRPRARAAYQDFFELWNNADPEIPILRQARAEYGELL